jgi:hypothetical protein
MIFILLILIIIFGALFQKRLCEITGEDFHWLFGRQIIQHHQNYISHYFLNI